MICKGRFHFTHYPVGEGELIERSGFEVKNCLSHRDAYFKAFEIFCNPIVQKWSALGDYSFRRVLGTNNARDLIIEHPEVKLKIYNPNSSSRAEGVFIARGLLWEEALGSLFDQIGTNIFVEEGDLR